LSLPVRDIAPGGLNLEFVQGSDDFRIRDIVVEHAVDQVALEFGETGDFSIANATTGQARQAAGAGSIYNREPVFAEGFRRRWNALAGRVGAASWRLETGVWMSRCGCVRHGGGFVVHED